MQNTLDAKEIYYHSLYGANFQMFVNETFHDHNKIKWNNGVIIGNWKSVGFDRLLKYGTPILSSISSISDEDAIEVARIQCPERENKHYVGYGKYLVNNLDTRIVNSKVATTDYLRSKSYALPWNCLSVEELQSRGWLRLKL